MFCFREKWEIGLREYVREIRGRERKIFENEGFWRRLILYTPSVSSLICARWRSTNHWYVTSVQRSPIIIPMLIYFVPLRYCYRSIQCPSFDHVGWLINWSNALVESQLLTLLGGCRPTIWEFKILGLVIFFSHTPIWLAHTIWILIFISFFSFIYFLFSISLCSFVLYCYWK